MKTHENGVLSKSNVYFYNTSAPSKKAFFYPICLGHYFYAPNYHLKRTSYDSFLIMYVISGSCTVKQGAITKKADSGKVVLLDCYQPHEYYTSTGWEAIWIHFDGVTARNYFDMIVNSNGYVVMLKDIYRFTNYLNKIYNIFNNGEIVKEAQISNYLNNILTELILHSGATATSSNQPDVIDEIITYINENLSAPLALSQLAERANLSPYYFSRMFKKEIGLPPHEYIISTRINSAKFYLTTTTLTVKEIALNLGFMNESTFCTTFKTREKMTPSEYRAKCFT